MGRLTRLMSKLVLTEVMIDGNGFVVKEALTQQFKIDHPVKKIITTDQWRLIFDDLLDFDVKNGDLTGLLSYSQDPLLLLHYLLQRAEEPDLKSRGCLATKYPV